MCLVTLRQQRQVIDSKYRREEAISKSLDNNHFIHDGYEEIVLVIAGECGWVNFSKMTNHLDRRKTEKLVNNLPANKIEMTSLWGGKLQSRNDVCVESGGVLVYSMYRGT